MEEWVTELNNVSSAVHPQQAEQQSADQCDNPERRARWRKDSRRCLSCAVVNPHRALEAYMSLAIMTAL